MLFKVREEMRTRVIRIRAVKKRILLAIAATALIGSALGQSNDSPPSAFNGVWQRENSDDTVTIYVTGDTVIITNSAGGAARVPLNGDKIEYSGTVNTADEGKTKTTGTYEISADGNSLIKRRQIYYSTGTEEETVKYTRAPSSSATPTPAPIPTPLVTPTPTPTLTPARSSPFIGVWRPADDSGRLTITVNGRNAVLKYSAGSRDSGTIQGRKLECESVSESGGTKSSDTFEMSSNGRTLIRRRTLQSPKGEIGHETLTYDRVE
jgi:hypothetical protein